MPRISRLLNPDTPTIYHVMSRTALDGYPLEDNENDYLLEVIRKFSRLYFVDILGFALMGNHFHLIVRMHPDNGFSDEEIHARLEVFRSEPQPLQESDLPRLREKLSSLSEFMKDIKQTFTRYFNKKRNRSGFFWGQRFKSVILQEGPPLLHCLAYIDLNPVRANLCDRPEEYRWNTLGYIAQRDNRDGFLKLEFGLQAESGLSLEERIAEYRSFVYEVGTLPSAKGKSISPETVAKEQKKGYRITRLDRFRYRTRYFSDSGVIGSKQFISEQYQRFKDHFHTKNEKQPVPIQGLTDCFSLKRLAAFGT